MARNINISIGGKWHFYDIVAAANEMGELNKFYTSIYFKNKQIVNTAIGRKFHFSNRYSTFFPSEKVVANPLPELFPKLLKMIHLKTEGQALRLRCDLFDHWTANNMEPCKIFHSQDGFCLETAKRMKQEGATFICDRGIVSASYLQRISKTEYAKYGIKKEYADCHIMDKCHKEHLLADCILVPTETVRQSLVSEGVPKEKMRIVPYGVDLCFFNDVEHNSIGRDTFRVLFVGEISFRKGCHYLLDAWKKLNLSNAELILIGHVEKEFEVYLRRYSGRNYKLISYISQTKLLDYYRSAVAFILPSLAEGSARVIYEAMACGLPVIYTDMAGSIARNGIDGIEIPSYNTEAIIESINELFKNPEQGYEMGMQGKEWVKNYSKENYRNKIKEIYRNFLSQSI